MHVPLAGEIPTHDGAELTRATLPPGECVIGREPGVPLIGAMGKEPDSAAGVRYTARMPQIRLVHATAPRAEPS